MIKFFLIVCGFLSVACLVFFFAWRLSKNENKQQKIIIDKLSKRLCDVSEANSQLRKSISILKTNREKADEKIDNLHNGDSVDNAIDELSKRKS